MDSYAIVRTFGALALILGLMASVLWLVRRFNVRLPGQVGGGALRRLEMVERTALDSKRSVALLRRDGREHLILIAPEGHLVIESGIRMDAADRKAQAEREAEVERQRREQEEAIAAARANFARLTAQVTSASTAALNRVRAAIAESRNSFERLVEESSARRQKGAA